MSVPAHRPATRLAQAWSGLQARERRLIGLAVLCIALALLWTQALAPAWQLLRNAPAQRAQLQSQLQYMQGLQREAQALAELPRHSQQQAAQALQQATERILGTGAQLSINGPQAELKLDQVTAADLAAWLAEVRANARSAPSQAQLQRQADAPGAPARWSGSLSLMLPP